MPRKPGIWQRGEDGWFYTTFRGEQTKLSKDRGEAERAFHALHAQEPDEETLSFHGDGCSL